MTQKGEVAPEIDVTDAVRIANEYFNELFGSPYADLALEEVERAANGDWHITLGYSLARRTATGAMVTVTSTPRNYKILAIDSKTGDVKSMKVRKI